MQIAVGASDQRVPEEVDEAVVVDDIIHDEFPPQFTNEPYGISITDSQQLNVGIFSVQAFDPDLNNQVRKMIIMFYCIVRFKTILF